MTNTIVALTDFSEAAEAGLERAASLAAHRGGQLRIIYVAEKNRAIDSGALARLGLRSRQLSRRYNLAVEAASQVVLSGAQLIDAVGAAQLVVTGAVREAPRAWFWRDSLPDQLMRNGHCPILVVNKGSDGPYKRMLVGVDFSERSRELVSRACETVPHAELHLFHVIGRSDEARLRSSDASIDAIKAYRRQVNENAEARLFRFADSLDARRNRVMFFVGYGDVALQTSVQQEAVSADLIVVGKQRQSAIGELLLGSVARRLVRIAASDVLVVPQRAEHMFVVEKCLAAVF
ncbi:MAG: universal stress protein [Pseudomonadota bacterium]